MKEEVEGIVRFNSWDNEYYIENQEFNCSFGMILPDVGTRVRVTVETLEP